MTEPTLAALANELQDLCDAVADAHGASHYVISRNPYLALASAKVVADTHATHAGDWPMLSCDAELFALEWRIHLWEVARV